VEHIYELGEFALRGNVGGVAVADGARDRVKPSADQELDLHLG